MSRALSSASRSGVPAALCRLIAAVFGGYAVMQAFTVAGARLLQLGAQWPRSDALVAAALPAFVVYLVTALRVFSAPTTRRACVEPLGVVSGLALTVWLLERLA